ncbi:peptidylprolyl isomerase [Polaribacter uvawellassae]|uniref:peptidylprolyl isomerase n=1 Tax=Polaribacter uvawellassae TaxID=3133495 RepID=UPI00321B962D
MKFFKLFFVVAILLVAACKPAKYPDLKDGLYADIETNKGDIVLKLYQEDVPLAVSNFVSLAEGENTSVSDSLKGKKYYDGLLFHRVLKDFMIQGGDPLANGTGGPGYVFEDEFPRDSIGSLKYKHDAAGVLSMANGGPGLNGSQFFITHKETPWLDGIHSVFGKVEKGQDIVNLIEVKDTIKKVTIIRVGSKAKGFDAAKVFETEMKNSVAAKQKRIEDAQKAEVARYNKFLKDKVVYQKAQGFDKATETESGLRILTLKKGKGKKFSATTPTTMHYNMMLADGTPIQSTFDKDPFTFTLSQQPMIPGVNEAIENMRQGDKARLFIPYNLGYGERAYGPFPAKSDLIFELEILKVGK